MAFEFTKTDKIDELPGPIKTHVKTFVINRITQFDSLLEAIEEEDFEDIRMFCHAQLGVAASYNCFKLDEITSFIQELARQEVMEPIKEVIPTFEQYLAELKLESLKL